MADENLRLQATVVDGFTAPLRKLRSELDATKNNTSGKEVAKDWALVRERMRGIGTDLKTFVAPAFTALGITSIGVGVAITQAVSAVKGFATATNDMRMFGRQIGMNVDQLREFKALGERFGQDWGASQNALKTFAGNIDQVQRRVGEAYNRLLNMNLGDLAAKLVAAPNMEAAVNEAMKGLRNIQSPQRRREVAELLFGTDQMATVASESSDRMRAEIRKRLGETTQDAEAAAKSFQDTWSRISESLEGFKHHALTPALIELDNFMKKLESPESIAKFQGGIDGITNGIKDFTKWLSAIGTILDAIERKDFGALLQGLRSAEGASGPLARKLAPQAGDEALNLRDRLGNLNDLMNRQDNLPPAMRMTAAQQEALRREIEKLTAQLKRMEEQGTATIQKQSLLGAPGGGGGGFGGLIQAASFGGGGGGGWGGYGTGAGWAGNTLSGASPAIGRAGGGGGGGSSGGGGSAASGLPSGSRGFGIPEQLGPLTPTPQERQLLATIMKHESAGRNVLNYVGRQQGIPLDKKFGSTAQGYFQMLNTNWRNIAPKYGIKTPNAMASSFEEQAIVALHLLRNGGIKNWSDWNPTLRAALSRGQFANPDAIPSELSAGGGGMFPRIRNRRELAEAAGSTDISWPLGWGRRDMDGTKGDRMSRAANDSFVGGQPGTKIDANGKVSITLIGKGLEDANARTSSEGIFTDVEVSRGSQTASAR